MIATSPVRGGRVPVELRHRTTIALAAVTLLGLLLRLYHLGTPSLNGDEALSAMFYSRPLLKLFPTLVSEDLHPPLYPLLLGGWMAIFGWGEVALRLPSVIVGTALVPATYLAARVFWPRDRYRDGIGLLAAALTAVSPVQLAYSQIARNYILIALLGLVGGMALFRALRTGTRRDWLIYMLALAAGFYTHYLAFLLLPAQVLLVLLFARAYRARLQGFALALLGALALFAPWALYMVRQLLRITDVVAIPLSVADLGRAAATELVAGTAGGDLGRLLLPLLALAFLLVALSLLSVVRSAGTTERAATLYVFLAVAVPAVLLMAAWSVVPKYGPRYLLIAAPPLTLLIARGLVLLLGARAAQGSARPFALAGRTLGVLLSVAALGGSALGARYSFAAEPPQDYRGLAAAIRAEHQPGDVIGYMPYAWQGVGYYLIDLPIPSGNFNLADDFPLASAWVRDWTDEYSRVWLVWYFPEWSDPAGFTRHALDERSSLPPTTRDYGTLHLTLYTVDPARRGLNDPLIDHPADMRFENGAAFKGWSVLRAPARPGTSTSLDLHWQLDRPASADWKVVVTVEDAAEHVVARLDRTPVLPLYAPTRWRVGDLLHGPLPLDLPPGTPPGSYQLRMFTYDEATGREIGLLGPDGRVVGTRASIGEMAVDRPAAPASPEAVQIKQRFPQPAALPAPTGPGLTLLGADLPGGELAEGDQLDMSLLWRAPASPGADYTAVLQGLGADGKVVMQSELSPVVSYPTGRWQAGDVWLGRQRLKLPLDLPGGKLRLQIGLGAAGPFAPIGEISVKQRPVSRDIPTMQHQLGQELGGMVRLLGYDLDATQVKPGGQLKLTLYWQAIGPIDRNYKVFDHVVGPDARPVGQQDAEPADGAVKMVVWKPGEVVKDLHVVPVQPNAPPGDYRLIVGLYDPDGGKRLPVSTGGDSVDVAPIRVG